MIQEWLERKQGQVFRYKMEKFRYALDLLGDPHLAVPVVHVAGTNGKGSTVAMLRGLFQEHGLRVGSFTSPHLVSVEDRICINGMPVSTSDFWAIAEEIRKVEEQVAEKYEGFSYFETLTLLMFVYFHQQELDLAVIEVGIGGLHDVTNVVQPVVSVITSIGLDHQELLGTTLAEIAAQKAGIIKPQTPVVVGPLPDEALAVCLQKAHQMDSPVSVYGRDFSLVAGQFVADAVQLERLEIGLKGSHQLENAGVALRAFLIVMEKLELPVSEQAIRSALAQTTWAGRLELVASQPDIYLDGAHNVPAIDRLIDYISSENVENVTILFAALARKDYQEMVAHLQRRLPKAKLSITAFEGGAYDATSVPVGMEFVPDYVPFLEEFCRKAGQTDTLFVTGSLYFISDIRAYLLGR